MKCIGCTGPLMLLGLLGSMAHYRCRNCGLDQSGPAPEEEENVWT